MTNRVSVLIITILALIVVSTCVNQIKSVILLTSIARDTHEIKGSAIKYEKTLNSFAGEEHKK